MAAYTRQEPVVLAYKAAAEAIRARDASMFNKLTYVQNAARTFEEAVQLDPQNPEIRFLRFSVESNLPAFLGLSKHVDEDKELLLSAALNHPKSGLDSEAFRTVRNFLVGRGHVSEEQAQHLSKVAE
jgi:Tfp pilus assembly protein PilF